MVFSHAFFASSLIDNIFSKKKNSLSFLQENLIYFAAIVGSIFPDLDISLMLFNPNLQHRQLVSHSIIPYLMLLGISIFISKIKKDLFFKNLSFAFFIGCASHILLDMFSGGLSLFAPLSYKVVGWPIYFTASEGTWGITYLTSKYMIFEILFFAMYLLTIGRNKNKVILYLPLFFFFISMVLFFVVLS